MINTGKILIGIIGAVIIVGFAFSAASFIKDLRDTREAVSVPNESVSAFQMELIDRALARGPHPIEGFDASMLLDIFPGLAERDFDGVVTGAGSEEGVHVYIDGELRWERTADRPITAAERTVSQEGYRVLLENLSQRLGMPATSEEEAVAIVEMIDIPSDITEHILSKRDFIRVYTPRPLSTVVSPLTVYGEARGPWYFEANFQLTLVDWDGRIIAESFATAQDSWMTEEFVPFTGTIEFENPSFPDATEDHFSKRGTIIFQKANPSGLPERADALEIPVFFE